MASGPVALPSDAIDAASPAGLPADAIDVRSAEPPKSVGGFLSNVASSGLNLAGNVVGAVTHPLKTLDALGAVPVGLYQKGTQKAGLGNGGLSDDSSVHMLDAMVDHMKQRYGSLENVKQTLYKDPAGVAADLSTVLDLGGFAAELGGLTRTANAVKAVSGVVNPVSVGAQAGKLALKGASKLTKVTPETVYAGALNVPLKTDAARSGQMVATGLKYGVPVSEGGAAKLDKLITDLDDKVKSRVDYATQNGVKVDPRIAAQYVQPVKQRFGNQVNPESDLNAIDQSTQEFLASRGAAPATPPKPVLAANGKPLLNAQGQPVMNAGTPATAAQPIPADQALALKKGTYQQIREQYGKLSSAQIESQKALVRGISDELKSNIPELRADLGEQGKMLDLQPALEAAVNRMVNRPGGIGVRDLLTGMAGEAVSGKGTVGVALALTRKVLQDPMVRSRLAMAMNKAQQMNPAKYGTPNFANLVSRINAYSGPPQQTTDASPAAPQFTGAPAQPDNTASVRLPSGHEAAAIADQHTAQMMGAVNAVNNAGQMPAAVGGLVDRLSGALGNKIGRGRVELDEGRRDWVNLQDRLKKTMNLGQ